MPATRPPSRAGSDRSRRGTRTGPVSPGRRYGRPRKYRPYWTQAEERVAARFARQWLQGRFRNASEAAVPCSKELPRVAGRHERPMWSVVDRVRVYFNLRMARARAVGPARVLWDPAELRLVDRFAARYNQGIYPDFITASLACLPALEDVRHRILRRNPDHPLARYSRHLGGVAYRLRIQALKQKAA
jgi:hypothetical protein